MSEANKKRRVFDQAFKQNAVRMVLDEGMSQEEVGRKLDLGRTGIARWVKAYRASPGKAFPGKGRRSESAEAELARIRRELKEVQDERDILKKALLIFTRPKGDGSPL